MKKYQEIYRETKIVKCPTYKQRFTKDPTLGGVPLGPIEFTGFIQCPITYIREIIKEG